MEYITIRGKCLNDYILDEKGRLYILSTSSGCNYKGFFLLRKTYSGCYELLRILKLDPEESKDV